MALIKEAMAGADTSTIPMDGHFHQIVAEETKQIEDTSDLERPFGKFDKSPNTKCPRVSGRPFNNDKIQCFE